MSLTSWLRTRTANRRPERRAVLRPTPRFRPDLEPLGDRVVPAQVTLSVTSLADSGAGSLRAAILTADAGKASDKFTINIAVNGTIDLLSPLPALSNTITIQGPGASNLTVERAAGVSFSSAIVTVGAGSSVTLSGVTITNANNGGIFNNGTLTVANCAIVNNSNTRAINSIFAFGGGVTNHFGTLTVTNSVLSGNTAPSGGSVENFGTMSITGSTVSGNTAIGFTPTSGFHSSGSGGAIDSVGFLTVDGCTIRNNSADGRGGGIAGQATISASTFSGNSANEGGGIASTGLTTITGCTIAGNTAAFGGGLSIDGNPATVSGCTFTGNTATGLNVFGTYLPGEGGAIWNNGRATIRDSLFTGNSAEVGGGVFNGFEITIRGCTVSANTASTWGGGLYSLGTATVQESTFSGNTAGSGGGIFNDATGSLGIKDSTVTGNFSPVGADLFNLGAVAIDDSTIAVIGP